MTEKIISGGMSLKHSYRAVINFWQRMGMLKNFGFLPVFSFPAHTWAWGLGKIGENMKIEGEVHEKGAS